MEILPNPFDFRAASQGAFAGSDITSDERELPGHAGKYRSEPGKAGVSGSMPERSTADFSILCDDPLPLFLTQEHEQIDRDLAAMFEVHFNNGRPR